MNETSLYTMKLVSRRRNNGLASLGKGPQAARADTHPDRAISLADRYLLDIEIPAPLGMALRKADVIAELWAPLATDSTLAGHIYPLTIARLLLDIVHTQHTELYILP